MAIFWRKIAFCLAAQRRQKGPRTRWLGSRTGCIQSWLRLPVSPHSDGEEPPGARDGREQAPGGLRSMEPGEGAGPGRGPHASPRCWKETLSCHAMGQGLQNVPARGSGWYWDVVGRVLRATS